jgi:DNA-binding NarL/FixJ family response regulator
VSPTVIILDDHPLVRDSVVASLSAAIPGIAFAYCGPALTSALDVISSGVTCTAVLDLDLGDGRVPAESAAQLAALGVPTAIMSAHDQPLLVQNAIIAGARAYVPKRAIADQLPQAVLALDAGKPYRSPDFAAILVPGPGSPCSLPPESERALVLHAAGLPLSAIAQRLGIDHEEAEALLESVWAAYGL